MSQSEEEHPNEITPLIVPPNDTTPLVDQKPGLWYDTFKLITISGAGLLADGYDLMVINMALAILTRLYPSSFTASTQGMIASFTLVGVMIGQVSFGTISDIVGRRCASITTAALTILGALLSSLVVNTSGGVLEIGLQLTLSRFLLGLGVGGEYPLSAAISKEVGPDRLPFTRSQLLIINMMAFSLGGIIQCIVILALLYSNMSLEMIWRVALACGAVPSSIAFALRLNMEEPDVKDSTGTAYSERDYQSWLCDFAEVVSSRLPVVIGACLSWMLFNFVAYGEGTFSSLIADALLGVSGEDLRDDVRQDALFVLAVSLCAFTGNMASLWLESRTSRCSLQLIGFAGLGVSNWLIARLLHVPLERSKWIMVSVFCVSSALSALLGVTTYLVPAESFPAAARGTCVGLAAASGKVGAVIGTALFPIADYKLGLSAVMNFCGFAMLAGCGVTWAFTPRHCLPEKDISQEKTM